MTSVKAVSIQNAPDFKDPLGNWVRSYNPEPYVAHITRSSGVWGSIVRRCAEGGRYQRLNPSYVGTTNGFRDYQDFAEWANSEYGYMIKNPNSTYWSLDKDLLIKGNKVYSPTTCMFIPQRANVLFRDTNRVRGPYPLGVTAGSWKNKPTASGKIGGVSVSLGSFHDPMDAHRAWQKFKVDSIRNLCKTDPEISNHPKLKGALHMWIDEIEQDLINQIETTLNFGGF